MLRLGVLLEIDGLDRERHLRPFGRERRLADARDPEHRLRIEGLLLRKQEGGKQERENRTHIYYSSLRKKWGHSGPAVLLGLNRENLAGVHLVELHGEAAAGIVGVPLILVMPRQRVAGFTHGYVL